ncbi:hypothetical protein [Shewanella sp. GXUN23E]|uniref:hypothetical protein n=1 Tax=Shewanella sp. GXUN23E TaxID=3422498 RepID=UPI003D7E1B30
MKSAKHIILAVLVSGVLTGCASNIAPETAEHHASRLWIPIGHIMDWSPLFPQENVSFTVSYSITTEGEIAELKVYNIVPSAEYDPIAFEQLNQIKFVATAENVEKQPVSITTQIELGTL